MVYLDEVLASDKFVSLTRVVFSLCIILESFDDEDYDSFSHRWELGKKKSISFFALLNTHRTLEIPVDCYYN